VARRRRGSAAAGSGWQRPIGSRLPLPPTQLTVNSLETLLPKAYSPKTISASYLSLLFECFSL
jgi:hypothetical protein